jgi:hypothetical protein
MLRLTKLSNKFRRRTLRAMYAHTQAYPYAATLDPAFDRTQGQLAGANAVTDSKCAIQPGSVLVKEKGEMVTLSGAAGASQRAFGLAGNFVGGELDELGDNAEISVWKGVGSVWQILKPAFDPTNVLTEADAEVGTVGTEVYMNSNTKGQLAADAAGVMTLNDTARLLSAPSVNTIIVELLV